jgi:hypothetical protein
MEYLMGFRLEMPPELENRIRDEADRRGVEPEQFLLHLVERQLESQRPSPSNPLASLFAKWAAEDETDDPEELARRSRDWEELKKSINANHGSFREPIR